MDGGGTWWLYVKVLYAVVDLVEVAEMSIISTLFDNQNWSRFLELALIIGVDYQHQF